MKLRTTIIKLQLQLQELITNQKKKVSFNKIKVVKMQTKMIWFNH